MALHFVRFPDNHGRQYQNAVRVFGPPHFMHRLWDQRARREIAEGDVIVFAKGDEHQPVSPYNGDDEYYSNTTPSPRNTSPTPNSKSKNSLRISHRAINNPSKSISSPTISKVLDIGDSDPARDVIGCDLGFLRRGRTRRVFAIPREIARVIMVDRRQKDGKEAP